MPRNRPKRPSSAQCKYGHYMGTHSPLGSPAPEALKRRFSQPFLLHPPSSPEDILSRGHSIHHLSNILSMRTFCLLFFFCLFRANLSIGQYYDLYKRLLACICIFEWVIAVCGRACVGAWPHDPFWRSGPLIPSCCERSCCERRASTHIFHRCMQDRRIRVRSPFIRVVCRPSTTTSPILRLFPPKEWDHLAPARRPI